MEHIKVLGYFKESEVVFNPENEKLLYFVAYENSYNYSQRDQLEGKKWVEGFNVMDGHFQLMDRNYLISCKEISKYEYLKATEGYVTPEVYL
ncbi:hypothetical protein CIL05_07105 [Virgibacillus profundi]|uniref:Uncharacterized protein n=1 Tax=Virgibacillus profundi TaxID=2024555 RepID=A0A2A2IFT1_9BACI|nr:hypothetical protein [Virgibacillus profundi]PAV30228.1 hypothetical protein CIL05_07105 [Virgibacillus profundi]PXY54400.1 hypothetical protein CIT14_07190 [Virgibacillus profundi]